MSGAPSGRRSRTAGPTRVGAFFWYLPDYRRGLCRHLHQRSDMEFTFCVPGQAFGQYLQTLESSTEFRMRTIRSWRLRLPGTENSITLQPYALWSLLARHFDVLVQANDILGIDVWLNCLLARLIGGRVCLWGHGISRPETALRCRLRTWLMRLAHAVVFYSEGGRQRWLDRGFPPEKLFVAHNALDTAASAAARQRATPAVLAQFRQERGLEGRAVVLFVGRLQQRKRPDLLVRAMQLVAQRRPQALALFIGDGPARAELADLVTQLHLAQHVRLEGPLRDEDTLARYFLCARVGAIPAAAGLFIQHAFGYGVPVVLGDAAASHGPEAELVQHGQTGLYFTDGDVQSLADALFRLLADPAEQQRIGANAQAVIATRHNLPAMAAGLCAAINYCVSGSRGQVQRMGRPS